MFKSLITICFLIVASKTISAQISNPDPFRVLFPLREYEIVSREQVDSFKIKKVTALQCHFKRNGEINENPDTNYYIDFNREGNPVLGFYIISREKRFFGLRKINTFSKTIFRYDSLQRLIDFEQSDFLQSHSENQILYQFFYDSSDALKYQDKYTRYNFKQNRAFICNSEFHHNDKEHYELYYLNNLNIDFIVRTRTSGNEEKLDTVKYNCPLDSLYEKDNDLHIIRDSIGRVISIVSFTNHAMPIGGGTCLHTESPYDTFMNVKYNDAGKINQVEYIFRNGEILMRNTYSYFENGLLKSDGNSIFNYEFY